MKTKLIIPILAIFLLSFVAAGSFDIQTNVYNNQENFDIIFSFDNSENLNISGYTVTYEFNSNEVEPVYQGVPEDNIFSGFGSATHFGGSDEEASWIVHTFFPLTQSHNGSGVLGTFSFKRLTNGSITLIPQPHNVGVFLIDETFIDFGNVITIDEIQIDVNETDDNETTIQNIPNWVIQDFGSCINFQRKAYYKDTNNSGQREPNPIIENCKMIRNIVPSVAEVKISPTKSFTIKVNSTSQVKVMKVTEQTNKIILNVSSSGVQEVWIDITNLAVPRRVLVDGVPVTFSTVGNLIIFTTHFSERIITLDYTPVVVQSSSSSSSGSSRSTIRETEIDSIPTGITEPTPTEDEVQNEDDKIVIVPSPEKESKNKILLIVSGIIFLLLIILIIALMSKNKNVLEESNEADSVEER